MRAAGPGPLRLLIGSFLAAILCGTMLLRLPLATPPDQRIGWLDALFTATSATCVTGLTVRDTGTGFTPFGQGVILGLIQVGGLGVMTFSLFILALLGGRVSLAQRSIFERTIGGAASHQVRPLLRLVFLFTFGCEAAGALILFLRWWPEMGAARALWHSVFHSISAFCQAGFFLRPDSLAAWRSDPLVVLPVSILILLGGFGFFTLYDAAQAARTGSRSRLSVHSKLAFVVSAVLVVLGTMAIWVLEAGRAFAGMGPGEQLLAAYFQSVTTRSGGLTTVDIATLGPGTLFLMIILMAIGGSPGSCAGGIKTTTLGVLVVATVSRLRGHRHVNVFRRTLGPETVQNTLTLAQVGLAVALAGAFALLLMETHGRYGGDEPAAFIAYLFETVSALGTVGLSTGVTPGLSPAGKLLVAFLMFCGRVGPLTLAAALASGRGTGDWQYPEEEVMVG
ncbi:MAG TPA: TrkH family potassium uptake protein [Thermoanaerobaculia bacterium]|nr:TrkH family potassium uptake protein [Thermoanaerobaculia bacterium]